MPDDRAPGPDLRVLQANERTMLAWIRTSLGIMAFGFVVARLGLWLAELRPAERGSSLWVGVVLVLMGAGSLALAAIRFVRAHRAIVAGRPYVPGVVASVAVAIALAAGGLGLAAYLAWRG